MRLSYASVIAELRKLSSVSLATVESDADLILNGDGELWAKGYRSLNGRVQTGKELSIVNTPGAGAYPIATFS